MIAGRFYALRLLLAVASLAMACKRPTGGADPNPYAMQHDSSIVTGKAFSAELAAMQGGAGANPVPGGAAVPGDPTWARREFRADGDAAAATSFSFPEARKLLAKRQAVTAAWRAMGAEVGATRIPGYESVGDYAQRDDTIRVRIDQVIQSSKVVDERVNSDGSYHVTMAVRGDSLAEFLPPSGAQPAAPGDAAAGEAGMGGGAASDYSRAMAEAHKLAESQARQNLMAKVRAVEIAPNRPLGPIMQNDPALAGQIQTMVMAAPVSARRYDGRGNAEVDLQFDMSRAREAAMKYAN